MCLNFPFTNLKSTLIVTCLYPPIRNISFDEWCLEYITGYTYIYTHVYVCETALQCHPQYSADVQFCKLSQIHKILTKLHQLP